MQIKELEVKDLQAISEWLYHMNEQDQHFVAWLASDENEIYEQVWTLTQFRDPLAYIAWENNQIIGFLGILPFFEQKLCRLLGPFAIEQEKAVMEGLWNKASLTMEQHFNAVKVASFKANTTLVEFCERHQFHLYNIEKTMVLDREDYKPAHLDGRNIVKITEEDKLEVARLHPNGAYYTTAEMMDLARSDRNHLWGYQHEGRLIGYIYFETILPGEEGEICFVNVDADYRGKGIGSVLIDHALQHAFLVLELDEVSISVRTTNDGAENLYRTLGFHETHTIFAYEKLFQEPIIKNPFH
ncbi:GNAT family N-acetyltransferase [Thalassobacillus pellis]|uniref:GNAT family N-acetyltransferase n=1 Tax=Thalassobacillus pellis TaxID=748008 RepID=UPI001961E2C5|nr:GNAT family N-acetyltransferase [Thalassobacillus pellis]MBM7551837.1 ribosomal protein S18 acetylase RimI-like enzyme [Thalassobacillus pellis]